MNDNVKRRRPSASPLLTILSTGDTGIRNQAPHKQQIAEDESDDGDEVRKVEAIEKTSRQ